MTSTRAWRGSRAKVPPRTADIDLRTRLQPDLGGRLATQHAAGIDLWVGVHPELAGDQFPSTLQKFTLTGSSLRSWPCQQPLEVSHGAPGPASNPYRPRTALLAWPATLRGPALRPWPCQQPLEGSRCAPGQQPLEGSHCAPGPASNP